MRDPVLGASLTPLDSSSLSERVYSKLRNALMRGELVPDQRLKIGDVAAQLGTSETPVREALFQLARDGAIEIKPRHFLKVRRLSMAEYLEIRDIRLTLIRASGDEETLLHIPGWDFHWQDVYYLQQPIAAKPGDSLRVTCIHDNSPAAQPMAAGKPQAPRYVIWGEGTNDEMCLGVVLVTDR